MHKSDERPGGLEINKRFSAQSMALFCFVLVIFPPLGVIVAYLVMNYANKLNEVRPKVTAMVALIFNLVVLLLLLIVYFFLKEASMVVQ